jgi:hypothetical protein
MAENRDSTGPCWRSFDQSLAWIRQGHPDVTDEGAWDELNDELVKAWAGASKGVPIAKFRYPLRGGMFDLVVLLRNKHLTFEDIQWQNVECNLAWLKRRWPHEADAPIAVESVESPPALPAKGSETVLPLSDPDAAQTPELEVEPEGSPSAAQQTELTPAASVEVPATLNPGVESESASPTKSQRGEPKPSSPKLAAQESRKGRPKEAASAGKLHGVERDVYDAMVKNRPRGGERGYATKLWQTKGFKKKGVPKKTVQNYVSKHRKDLEVEADDARKTDELLPKKTSHRK